MSKEQTTFPEWAVPGTPVLRVTHAHAAESVARGRIVRLTKTRIVVEVDGRYEEQYVTSRFDEHKWTQHGGGTEWRSAPRLVPEDSEDGRRLLGAMRRRRELSDALGACDAFRMARSVDAAHEAIAALTKYVEGED